nr:hypothetical protein B0A51_08426 [Rachicladosporium sp. CCFEE 5018]
MAKTRPDNKVGKITKPSPTLKPSVNVATLFAKPPRRDEVATHHYRKPPHPNYVAFLDTTATYRTNATASLAAAVEHEKAVLEARIYGEDINGTALDLPNVVTTADLDSLKGQAEALNTPFASLEIPVTRTNSKGKVAASRCTLGDAMAEFTHRSGALKSKIDGLIQQLAGVEGEIERVMVELRDRGEADEALKATVKDINDARREDKDSGIERQQKLQDFLKTF